MPSKIVDLSARSEIIRDEPFGVHFWECTPSEFRDYLQNPSEFLSGMGINIPKDCRIETTIENHDWIGAHLQEGGTIVCNVGTGNNVGRSIYRVVSFGHDHSAIGKYEKTLLHNPTEQQKR